MATTTQTTTTRTRPAPTTTALTTTALTTTTPTPRRSLMQTLRERRANQSDLARDITAYPATRSVATITLPPR